MEKAKLIKLRDTLKNGKNYPLIIYVNCQHIVIDESNVGSFTKWDDENGVVYYFHLINMQTDKIPSNKERAITVATIDYSEVHGMEIARLPLDDLSSLIDNISRNGTPIKDELKEKMIYAYNIILSDKMINLTSRDINNIFSSKRHGAEADAVPEKDDYYRGVYSESWQETHKTNEYNEKP